MPSSLRSIARRFGACRPLVAAAVAAATLQFSTSAAVAAEDRLTGLIEPVKATKPYRIGVTVVHLNDDFYEGIVYGIEDEAERSGVGVIQVSIAGAYGNVREQFAQLEAFKALMVDVAVVAPAAYHGFDAALDLGKRPEDVRDDRLLRAGDDERPRHRGMADPRRPWSPPDVATDDRDGCCCRRAPTCTRR